MRFPIAVALTGVMSLSCLSAPLRYRVGPGAKASYVVTIKGEGELNLGEETPLSAEGEVPFAHTCRAAGDEGYRMSLHMPKAKVHALMLGSSQDVPLLESPIDYEIDTRGRDGAIAARRRQGEPEARGRLPQPDDAEAGDVPPEITANIELEFQIRQKAEEGEADEEKGGA